jgi:hypothetical protein
MRLITAILLSAACCFVGTDCYSQNPCSALYIGATPGEGHLTGSQLVHRLLLTTPVEVRRHLSFGDVEFILKCGTQREAAEFFAAIRNTAINMDGATVLEAGKHTVRVGWDDGFRPSLGTFSFEFDAALDVTPQPGDKILISGTYSSYSQDPFQINLTNSSFVLPPKIEVPTGIK